MKREVSNFKIERFYPLIFWYECRKCQNEFRRERGGVFETGPTYGGRKKKHYVCGSCLSDFNVSDKGLVPFFFGERPPPPGPPPTTEYA